MLKIFITCEGRYSIVFIFHLQFRLHMEGIKRMNRPYYFLRDLKKMAMKVQDNPKTPFSRNLLSWIDQSNCQGQAREIIEDLGPIFNPVRF
jgi:hypothetical protein